MKKSSKIDLSEYLARIKIYFIRKVKNFWISLVKSHSNTKFFWKTNYRRVQPAVIIDQRLLAMLRVAFHASLVILHLHYWIVGIRCFTSNVATLTGLMLPLWYLLGNRALLFSLPRSTDCSICFVTYPKVFKVGWQSVVCPPWITEHLENKSHQIWLSTCLSNVEWQTSCTLVPVQLCVCVCVCLCLHHQAVTNILLGRSWEITNASKDHFPGEENQRSFKSTESLCLNVLPGFTKHNWSD